MTSDPTGKPRVGLLALTLELYETLAPDLRGEREQWLRGQVIPALEPIADVVFDRAVCRRSEVDEVVASLEAAGVDALLVILVSYSPSQISLPALKSTRLPIIVWNTQELFAVDEKFGSAEMTANHGVHGTQDLCNVLLRSGVKFGYVTSHLRDENATGELEDLFAAAAAVRRLGSARIGLLGYPFPGMGDFAVDTTHLTATLGCEWTVLTVPDYIARAEVAGEKDVARLVRQYRDSYDVATDITDADLAGTARVELALRGMIADGGLSAITYQFMAFGDDDRTPTVPFVAASRLMAEGIGFGGEGDIIAAAGSTMLNWLKAPASFTEIFTIDFGGNAAFLSHMGEANVAMARRGDKVPLVARPAPITPTRGRQLALVTCFEPGEATFCSLTLGPGGRWRLVASPVTILDTPVAADLPVPQSKIQPRGDVRDFLTAYAKAGGPHHAAICFGDATGRLKAVADLIDADYCEV